MPSFHIESSSRAVSSPIACHGMSWLVRSTFCPNTRQCKRRVGMERGADVVQQFGSHVDVKDHYPCHTDLVCPALNPRPPVPTWVAGIAPVEVAWQTQSGSHSQQRSSISWPRSVIHHIEGVGSVCINSDPAYGCGPFASSKKGPAHIELRPQHCVSRRCLQ